MQASMESVRVISVADLLRQSRPLTGAASLRPPTPSPPPSKKQRTDLPAGKNPLEPPLSLSPDQNPNPNPRTFSPLAHPALLIGTIALPSDEPARCGGSQNQCLHFSDATATVCCAVLDLDLDVLGRTVYVLAWNFVPFNRGSGGGFLEVIRWRVLPSELPIPSRCTLGEDRTRTCSGALRAVSPVFRVPCRNVVADADSVGFLAEIVACKCDLREQHSHSFNKVVFVYFIGPASCWHPAMLMLVGKLITVSGLKKKFVFVGEEESYLMFVATAETLVSLCQLPKDSAPNDGWIYVGIVTGVYMQGMAVELDNKVWLLITDPLLSLQHSFRIGAMVSVRNFHLVRPKFSWTRVLLLGTCARTSIDVQSFSLSETKCHFRTERQSFLGKFIESLSFSPRFWVLLLVACFRRKFAGIYSDKEILGSKNKEGLVQIYASRSLPSHAFQNQHGVFVEFCKHDQCTCKNELKMEPLKLVAPISNFLCKCEAIWVSITSQIQNDAKTVGSNNDGDHLSCEGVSNCRMIRRIISSEDLGLILMGTLEISPSSGRMQLVDSTGSVDVVVPDLLSNIDGRSIHEVKHYKLVLEGTQLASAFLPACLPARSCVLISGDVVVEYFTCCL